MSSPFPGMNPYLEGEHWLGFHGDLCTEIRRQLAPKIAPRYFPYTTRYFVPDTPDDVDITIEQMLPDVGIGEQGIHVSRIQTSAAAVAAPATMHVPLPREVPHQRIDIRDVSNRRLVTAIEFLSPSNKRGAGRKKYIRKRNKLLESSAHLMEVDLLRHGKRPPMVEQYPAGSYFVLVSRAERRPATDVWPIPFDQPLPAVPVPLLPGDKDVLLDLQDAVNNVYELGCYERAIDYSLPPDVPLSPEESAWVDQRLREVRLQP